MPGRNGTGPMGRGPMTGGGFGNCAGRGGAGFGGGMGRGMRRMLQGGGRFGFNAPDQGYGQDAENRALVRENEALRSELDAIKKRLDDMETRTGSAR